MAGVLTGKYRPGQPAPAGSRGAAGSPAVNRTRTPENEAIAEALRVWAEARGHTLGELAIAWLLSYLQRHGTWLFVGYRLLFGAVILLWFQGA